MRKLIKIQKKSKPQSVFLLPLNLVVLFFLLVITLSILYLFVGQLDLLDEVKSEFQMSNLSVLTYRDTDGRTGRCGCLFCVQSLISFTITIPRGWVFRLGSFNYDCLFVLCLCLSRGSHNCQLSQPHWVILTHFLSCPLSQDDINPVGGFSLRGCLVSSLNDNGVPSGESPSLTSDNPTFINTHH